MEDLRNLINLYADAVARVDFDPASEAALTALLARAGHTHEWRAADAQQAKPGAGRAKRLHLSGLTVSNVLPVISAVRAATETGSRVDRIARLVEIVAGQQRPKPVASDLLHVVVLNFGVAVAATLGAQANHTIERVHSVGSLMDVLERYHAHIVRNSAPTNTDGQRRLPCPSAELANLLTMYQQIRDILVRHGA
jgi:hypothetical protein